MNLDDSIEQIERYLKGGMTESEKLSFEAKLQSDASLFEKVEKQKALNRLIIEAGLMDIRQMMNNDLKHTSNKTKSTWIGGGLALVIISVIGVYYYTSNENKVSIKNDDIVLSPVNVENNKTVIPDKRSEVVSINKEKSLQLVNANDKLSNASTISSKANNTPVIIESLRNEDKVESTNAKSVNHKELDTQKVDCNNFIPNYSIKISPSTIHKTNGKILITTKESLVFTLTNGAVPFGGSFDELATGSYNLTIENDKGCKTQVSNIVVGQTFCIELEKETFSPTNENVFQLPIEASEFEEVLIYNSKMQQIRIFKVGGLLEWDGRDTEGLPVETGLYKFEVRYKNGERCLFNLTVFN